MKKIYFLILSISFITFGIGFLTGRFIYHQPTKELCLGTLEDAKMESYLFEADRCVTNLDPDNEFEIDYLDSAFKLAPTIEKEMMIEKAADYLLRISFKKLGVFTTDTYIWLTEDGAISGQQDAETHLIKEAKFISKETLDDLFKLINHSK